MTKIFFTIFYYSNGTYILNEWLKNDFADATKQKQQEIKYINKYRMRKFIEFQPSYTESL